MRPALTTSAAASGTPLASSVKRTSWMMSAPISVPSTVAAAGQQRAADRDGGDRVELEAETDEIGVALPSCAR